LKRNDIILIIAALAVAAGLLFAVKMTKSGKESDYVVVTVAGTEINRYPLNKDGVYEIEAHDGEKNVLVIKDGAAVMTEANCADQICVNQSAISKNGEMIVCLPHQLIITVEGSEQKAADSIAN